MWQTLATLRDLHEVGVPTAALASKTVPEKHRALARASSIFAAYLRKKHATPMALVVTDTVTVSVAGAAALAGTPIGAAADVRIEVVAGGAISGGAVTVRISRDDGAAGTWGQALPVLADGLVSVDGVQTTLSGTWAAGEAVTYTAGPDPGIRWAVAAIAAHALYYNRGADPKAMEPYKAAYEAAIGFGKALAAGQEAELDQRADATPHRAEGGPLYAQRTRDGFLRGEA